MVTMMEICRWDQSHVSAGQPSGWSRPVSLESIKYHASTRKASRAFQLTEKTDILEMCKKIILHLVFNLVFFQASF